MNNDFNKYQKDILRFVNTEGGRHLLGISNLPVIKVTPNSIHQVIGVQGDKIEIQAKFWGVDTVAEQFIPTLEKLSIFNEYKRIEKPYDTFLHFSGLERKYERYGDIYLATDPFTAGAGDGMVYKQSSVWATARGAATGDGINYTTPNRIESSANFSSPTYTIYRCFLPFDTSALSAEATITAATLTLTAADAVLNADTCSHTFIQTTQASNTVLGTADYNKVGSTEGASRYAYASWTGANVITLNATGRGWISLSSYTNLGVISNRDLDNSAPTGANQANMVPSENGTPANRPILNVTYTLPSASGFFAFF